MREPRTVTRGGVSMTSWEALNGATGLAIERSQSRVCFATSTPPEPEMMSFGVCMRKDWHQMWPAERLQSASSLSNGVLSWRLQPSSGGVAPPEEGWSRQESTPFDKLDADCSLSAGHIWCQSFRMQTPKDIISGSGGVDVAKQTLDWDLSIANPVAPLSASQLVMETPPRVTVRGSLIEPQIQGANPPTLGDGPPKTNSGSRSATPN